MPRIFLIVVGILIFLLVVAVGGFVGYTQLPKVIPGAGAGPEKGAVVEEKVIRLETKDLIALDPFTVNLKDSGFLVAEFKLGMNEKLKAPIEKDSMEVAAIRDSIISLLSSKTSDEIMTAEGKDTLREEIRVIVNDRYPKNRVAEVYIISFVVQL